MSPNHRIPPEFTTHSKTLALIGPYRPALTVAGAAFARAVDPKFLAIAIRDNAEPLAAIESAAHRSIPMERLYVTYRPKELAPNAAPPQSDLWSVVRSDEPKESVAHLTEFLRLPAAVQVLWDRLEPARRPRALLVFDVDRVAPYYTAEPALIRMIADLFRREGVSLIVTFAGPETSERYSFDHILRLQPPAQGAWIDGTLTVLRGPSSGAFAAGKELPLSSIVEVQELHDHLQHELARS